MQLNINGVPRTSCQKDIIREVGGAAVNQLLLQRGRGAKHIPTTRG